MADHAVSQDRLLSAARRTLLPHPFPPRLDVEVAGSVPSSDGASTFFYDHLWPRPGRLALITARVAGNTLESALRAAGLRHLLRAALVTVEDPLHAIGLCRESSGQPPFDAAVAILDTATGDLTSATEGIAVAGPVGAGLRGAGGLRGDHLTAGSLFWLAAGVATLPAEAPVNDSPQHLIQNAGTALGNAAIAVISYKLPTRLSQHETISLSNDLADIPRVIVAFEQFCARQGIAESTVQGVNVALDEILTNVVSYAFEDSTAHEIYVELKANGQRLVVDVKDDGRPFDPLQAPAPELAGGIDDRIVGGLGIHFVRSILDDVSYRRVGGWNIMTLEKTTAAEPQPDQQRPSSS